MPYAGITPEEGKTHKVFTSPMDKPYHWYLFKFDTQDKTIRIIHPNNRYSHLGWERASNANYRINEQINYYGSSRVHRLVLINMVNPDVFKILSREFMGA